MAIGYHARFFEHPSPRTNLEALYGLRFVAVLMIFIGNDISEIMGTASHEAPPSLGSGLAAFGYQLLFILAGFAVHYNFRDALRTGGGTAVGGYLANRFVRLFPAYLLCVAVLLATDRFSADPLVVGAVLPAFLSATQAWFYVQANGIPLTHALGPGFAMMWVVSVGWFFCLVYPLLAHSLRVARLRGKWVVYALLPLGPLVWLVLNAGHDVVDEFMALHAGDEAGVVNMPLVTGVRWFWYYSPYSRLFDFLAGVALADYALHLRRLGYEFGSSRSWGGLALGIGALIAVPLTAATASIDNVGPLWPVLAFYPICFFLVVTALLHRNLFTAILGSRPIRWLGDASLSIYLVHAVAYALFPSALFGWAMLAVVGGGAILHLIVERGLRPAAYRRLAGMPGTHWVSRGLARVALPLPFVTMAVVPMGINALRGPVGIGPFTQSGDRPPLEAAAPPGPGRIAIISAGFGGSCAADANNYTALAAARCDGRTACDITPRIRPLGHDPAPLCRKDFTVVWRCGDLVSRRQRTLPAPAGGRTLRLDCGPLAVPDGPPKGTIQGVQATLGANTGAPANNYTAYLEERCTGHTTCTDRVQAAHRNGDPAPGTGSAFAVTWSCGDGGSPYHLAIPERAEGKQYRLSCPSNVHLPEATIQDIHATVNMGAGSFPDNYTPMLIESCLGRSDCEVKLSTKDLAFDPAVNRLQSLDLSWGCGDGRPPRGYRFPNIDDGAAIRLVCP